MNSRERCIISLDHREPDRIPLDLGGSDVTGIHITAYRNFRDLLRLSEIEPRIEDINQQIAVMDEDFRELLGCDVRWVHPLGAYFCVDNDIRDEGAYWVYEDEWGIGWRMPKDGGFFYDMNYHPLSAADTIRDLEKFHWPNMDENRRYMGIGDSANEARKSGSLVLINSPCPGLTEMHAWLRGFDNYYCDLLLNRSLAEMIMDKVLELKMVYWKNVITVVGDNVDVIEEYDDLGGQERLLFSPAIYRSLIKPRHSRLFSYLKDLTNAKIFFHCCGAIHEIIPDLIEAGIDILNPVQVSARGMDSKELKREFGKDLVFWGAGVDPQRILSYGTPNQDREDVNRRINDLAPDGGFVFANVHNIQANVPPENLEAMFETLHQYWDYS